MDIRIIQWNISFKCNANKIADYLASNINGNTIVNLQEVLEPINSKLISILQPDDSVYSLDLREPGKYEGKNRKMGIATYVFGGNIKEAELITRSIFPERTLCTKIKFNNTHIKILQFHSLTGVDYKKAKSSNFASIADFIHSNSLDFFTCDANEPKNDALNDKDLEFFDNKDKGYNASLILGSKKVHSLTDAFKTYIINNNIEANNNPLATSYVIAKKFHKRYDHVYHSTIWRPNAVIYPYKSSIEASSDHSAVIGDFTLHNDRN